MRDYRGSFSIEFAILFPVMMLVIVGGMDLGMVMINKMQLEFATEAAARCFAIYNNPNLSPCDSPGTTAAYAAGLLPPALGISAANFSAEKIVCSSVGGPVGGRVTANYTYTPMILPSTIDIVARACYPI